MRLSIHTGPTVQLWCFPPLINCPQFWLFVVLVWLGDASFLCMFPSQSRHEWIPVVSVQLRFPRNVPFLKYSWSSVQIQQKPLVPWFGLIEMDLGLKAMHTDRVKDNESDCLLPGGITATAMTKRPLRVSAAITIYFIRDITCRWVIYYPPEVRNCAGKHWLAPIVTLQK